MNETFFQSIRTSINGFDGGGRGYHWFRSDGDENQIWFALAYPWPNTSIPRRVEFAVPVWAPNVHGSSDPQLKEDVQDIGDVLPRLGQIRGVSFKWLDRAKEAHDKRDIGVIAQEVEQAFLELVSGDGESRPKSVS